MKRSVLSFALLLFAFAAFAQQAAQKPKSPCAMPLLELYNEQNIPLPEGEIPKGKITVRFKKDPRCQDKVTYEVAKVYVVLVRGRLPLADTTLQGNILDLSKIQSRFAPGDRILFDVHELKYTTAAGKSGTLRHATNWHFKQSE